MWETGPSRVSYVSERVYRALLAAYPKEFRSEYGAQMAQVFEDLRREELGRSGVVGLVKMSYCTVLDLAVTALAERVSAARKIRRQVWAIASWRGSASPFFWLLCTLCLRRF